MARDHDVELLSPRLPPPPFPMSLWNWDLLERRHHRRAHYHCGRAQELPTGTGFAKEPVRDAWNQTEASYNPVIKILHWMLILWKKPNDFAACLISKSDEKPKSIQQNRSTLYTMQAAGRKVHQCGGAAGECCITKHVTGVRSLPCDSGNSTQQQNARGYDKFKIHSGWIKYPNNVSFLI